MASYHFTAKIIGRSDGRSVVAAAAYRAGEKIERDETGDTPDYRKKGGVVSAEILLPENAPAWAHDRAQLWNAVEAVETRKNSQLAREIELALPNELTEAEARDLALSWAQDELVSRGMVADVCIHDPEPAPGAPRNRHAHILCTTRRFDGDAWAKGKARDWNDKALLQHWRESWADAQNTALEAAGSSARVDHRTLAAQREEALDAGDAPLAAQFDRPPEPVLGVAAGAVEKRAREVAERRGVEYQPITTRGKELAQVRSIRSRLIAAWSSLRNAVNDIVSSQQSEPVTDPFSAPSISPDEDDPYSFEPS